MIRIGSRSLLAVAAAAVVMLWWSGCATTSDHDQPQINCCPVPPGAVAYEHSAASEDCWLSRSFKYKDNKYWASGYAWLHPETGEYCAEQGSSIGIVGILVINGPKRGNYYEMRAD